MVCPWALSRGDENYYLEDYDSAAGKVMHYRVDKMMKLSISEDRREDEKYLKIFDITKYA